jgi:serine/threonine protein kinase
LREIQALRRLSPHEHIISLEEVLYDQPTGRLALVFELMDANLYELIKGRRHYLNPQLIKGYMWQLMKSLDHMHRKGIFHRDIKPENILIENTNDFSKGLKLADLGSCRGIYSKQPYTEYISTRWYRAPECLLTDGYYGPEMDLWGAGCVMFEITSLYPLFPGSNEVDQINRIHKVLGTPSQEILNKFRAKGSTQISLDFPEQKGMGIPQLIPHAAPEAVDLIIKMLKYDAADRISAREAMRHPYFKECREADSRRALVQQQQQTTTSAPAGAPSGGADAQAAKASVKVDAPGQPAPAQQAAVVKQSGNVSGANDAKYKMDTMGKALPSISGVPSQDQRAYGAQAGNNEAASGANGKFLVGQPKPSVTVPPPSNNIAAVLPPIAGGNNVAANNSAVGANQKYMFTDGNRTNNNNARTMAQVSAMPVQKKKKKVSCLH